MDIQEIKALFNRLVNNKELMLSMDYSKDQRYQYRNTEKHPIKLHTIFGVLNDFGIITTNTGKSIEDSFQEVIYDKKAIKQIGASYDRVYDWRNPDRKPTLIGAKIEQLWKLGRIDFQNEPSR